MAVLHNAAMLLRLLRYHHQYSRISSPAQAGLADIRDGDLLHPIPPRWASIYLIRKHCGAGRETSPGAAVQRTSALTHSRTFSSGSAPA